MGKLLKISTPKRLLVINLESVSYYELEKEEKVINFWMPDGDMEEFTCDNPVGMFGKIYDFHRSSLSVELEVELNEVD